MSKGNESKGERLPRGTIKSFREFLNVKFSGGTKHVRNAGGHHRYLQKTRPYGDYLYAQDRAKFDAELHDALNGHEAYKEWSRP